MPQQYATGGLAPCSGRLSGVAAPQQPSLAWVSALAAPQQPSLAWVSALAAPQPALVTQRPAHCASLLLLRPQAALGGSPSRLGLVQAFLRVREKERGPLDFDQPGGVDTTWQRIYCCLRAGFHGEALQASQRLRAR